MDGDGRLHRGLSDTALPSRARCARRSPGGQGFSWPRPSCSPGRARRPRPQAGWPRALPANGTNAKPGGKVPSAKDRRNTHNPQSATVHYPYHPLYGQEIGVVRRYPSRNSDGYLIEWPDGSRRAIPGWMLDPISCAKVRCMKEPILALSALCSLRLLLDSQPFISTSTCATISGESLPPGGKHETKNVTNSAPVRPDGRSPVGSVSEEDAEPLPGSSNVIDPIRSDNGSSTRGGQS